LRSGYAGLRGDTNPFGIVANSFGVVSNHFVVDPNCCAVEKHLTLARLSADGATLED
jgi:hypothetical protein